MSSLRLRVERVRVAQRELPLFREEEEKLRRWIDLARTPLTGRTGEPYLEGFAAAAADWGLAVEVSRRNRGA
ncbi:MAG: hypothetical protein MI919_22190, partial [Holophagales bacterium]|nr:hypothetical protein [Holophagales bacterium]